MIGGSLRAIKKYYNHRNNNIYIKFCLLKCHNSHTIGTIADIDTTRFVQNPLNFNTLISLTIILYIDISTQTYF